MTLAPHHLLGLELIKGGRGERKQTTSSGTVPDVVILVTHLSPAAHPRVNVLTIPFYMREN